MAKRVPFAILYAPETAEHLDAIDSKFHGLIQVAVDEQLTFTPDVPTRNRKPMRLPAPFNATWELRCGPQNRFRVLYSIEVEARIVAILAIGTKQGNQLRVAQEEFEL